MKVELVIMNGVWSVPQSALAEIDLQYRKPYMAIVTGKKQFTFLPRIARKEQGKTRWYYDVTSLKPRDLVMAAGGGKEHKSPFRGQVTAVDLDAGILEVEALYPLFFDEKVARLNLIFLLSRLLKDEGLDQDSIANRVWNMTVDEFMAMVDTLTSAIKPSEGAACVSSRG